MTVSKGRIWGVATVALIAAVTMVAFAGLAHGQAPITEDAGVLRLHIENGDSSGTASYFRFDPADGSGGYTAGTEEFLLAPVTQKCKIEVAGPLVNLNVPQGHVGFFDDAIGHRISGAKGTPCGQLNGTTEMLELELTGQLAGFKMDFAELDIELKFDASMQFELFDGNDLVDTKVLDCTPASDCGPDSGDNDNFRYKLEAAAGKLFDRIVFTLIPDGPNSAGSLEGGADGTDPCFTALCDEESDPTGPDSLGQQLGTMDSLFHLVQEFGEIDCGELIEAGDGTTTPYAAITRHDNQLGAPCILKPYLFFTTADDGTGNQLVSFDPEGAQDAVYTAEIVFLPEAAGNPVNQGIEYDPEGDGTYVPMQWCDEVPLFGVFGSEDDVILNDPLPNTGTETWCIVTSTTQTVGISLFQTTWDLYGEDDPNWRPS